MSLSDKDPDHSDPRTAPSVSTSKDVTEYHMTELSLAAVI
jgi:hypothetical protein